MKLGFDELTVIYPESLWLELSKQQQEDAWNFSISNYYSCDAARWNTYINYLSLNAFLTYLEGDTDFHNIDFGNISQTSSPIENLASIWEFVNGTLMTVDGTKIVLIPSDKSNVNHFYIPQEWVDIPNWIGRYYLAVQVNLDDGWLRIWGCASHQQVREQAFFDPMDKVYCLSADELITDINVMWVARDFVPWHELKSKLLPQLSTTYIENLFNKNKPINSFALRSEITFEEWGALLSSNQHRYQLYKKCLANSQSQQSQNLQTENNLCQWLENTFINGWYALDTLLHQQGKTLTVQFRRDMPLNEVVIKGAKLIDLGINLNNSKLILLVGISPKIDDKYSICVQLHPDGNNNYLPPEIKLILLTSSGEVLQESVSRSYDHYIQLKKFKSLAEISFTIQVIYGYVTIREDFVLRQVIS